jgi:hypothetical protein
MKMQRKNTKRRLCGALALLSVLPGCNAMGRPPSNAPQLTEAQRRLKDVGLVLVVDAVPGVEMLGNEFFADDGDRPFYRSGATRLGNRATMAFPISVVPERVRVMWRDSSKLIGRPDNPSESTYAGTILGDHTFAVASRIHDDVVKDIRKNGGGLRLKFRLKPDGVLFGWDIERISGGLPRHSMAGGDFQEAGLAYELPGVLVYEPFSEAAKPYLSSGRYFVPERSSTIWRKGWYIDANGRKVLTEH